MEFDALRKINQPVFYVTNDPGRGLGLENLLPNYHIVCLDDHPLVELMQKQNVSVFCLEKELKRKNLILRSSSEILSHPLVLSFIKEKAKGQTPWVLFFKPQKKTEITAQKHNIKLLGNSSLLNKFFEDKINFFNIANENKLPVLPAVITGLKSVDFTFCAEKFGLPFVIQFGFGWAGNSTFFINDKSQLIELQKKYGAIRVKINRFVKGLTVLNNAVVLPKVILQSPPAVQIKPSLNLTSMLGGTGGRQWPAGLPDDQIYQIKQITEQVGELMRKSGYLGFFGLDFLIDTQTGEVFLSENNARLTASASFYTQLEVKNGQIPLLVYHLAAFLGEELIGNLPQNQMENAIAGSEIIGRNIFSRPIKIIQSLPTGIYAENLCLKKESYSLNKTERHEFWLNTAGEGRIVNPEIEMLKINTYEKVCDTDGNLTDFFSGIIKKIQSLMKIKNG